jgi:hypothetical protein
VKKKLFKILKRPTDSVRFQFYKPETEKTEPKPKKTEPNRFLSKKLNRTKTSRFKPVSVFLYKKISVRLLFSDKNRTEPKVITPKSTRQVKPSFKIVTFQMRYFQFSQYLGSRG